MASGHMGARPVGMQNYETGTKAPSSSHSVPLKLSGMAVDLVYRRTYDRHIEVDKTPLSLLGVPTKAHRALG
jgi:hypothetical protein